MGGVYKEEKRVVPFVAGKGREEIERGKVRLCRRWPDAVVQKILKFFTRNPILDLGLAPV